MPGPIARPSAPKISEETGMTPMKAVTNSAITRPRICPGTVDWIVVFVSELMVSTPAPPTTESGTDSHRKFLVALSERAKAVQESFEDRQTSTEEALAALLTEIKKNNLRKKEQAAKGLDGLTYFVLCKLTDDGYQAYMDRSPEIRHKACDELPPLKTAEVRSTRPSATSTGRAG